MALTGERDLQRGLVERAREGDESAFTNLVDLEGDRCFGVAYRILRDVPRAEDAVQQAFLLAWQQLPRLRDPERFEAWLYRLLVNACYEEARRHRRWSGHVRELTVPISERLADGPGSRDALSSVDDRDALERAFRVLSPEHRAVFVLHHHAGFPLARVGEILAIPLGTVKSRLHYATRTLRAALIAADPPVLREARPA